MASGDPLRLYWQELEALPRLNSLDARELANGGADPNRLTEGLLWLVAQEALDFAGQGVLLLDLMQEGAMGLLQAMEDPGPDPVERGRWHVRQAMARAVALQYLSTGEARGWWQPCGPTSRRTGGSWSGWGGILGRRSSPRSWASR
ncbi:MAG: hypothetical protein V8T29_04390 [Oscillospiraceae bacterium]